MGEAKYSMRQQPNQDSAAESGKLASRRKVLAGAVGIGYLAALNSLGADSAWARPRWAPPKWSNGGGGGSSNCFLEGTGIATADGERCIESLKIGDAVQTASGDLKPVKWIGRWAADKGLNQTWKPEHVPVRVVRGALDETLPHRDLYVSDEHCFFIDGLLIPAIDLVNGISIEKEVPEGAERLQYFHIELHAHDVILANGAAAETLRLEFGQMGWTFDNSDEYEQLFGSKPEPMPACAPRASNYWMSDFIKSKLRSFVAPIYDRRQPLEIIRDRLADQAFRKAA